MERRSSSSYGEYIVTDCRIKTQPATRETVNNARLLISSKGKMCHVVWVSAVSVLLRPLRHAVLLCVGVRIVWLGTVHVLSLGTRKYCTTTRECTA
jgi:hypothetical protein